MRQFISEHSPAVLSKATLATLLVLALAAAPGLATAQEPAAATAQSAGAEAKPVIFVENPDHDFGEVWSGPEVKYSFTVYNRGNAPLEIRGVRVDCGCTSIGRHPEIIEPGKSGEFPFGLRTVGLNGKIAPKRAIITSNDPATPELILRLSGTFRKRIEITPPAASFGTIITSEPVSQKLTIKNNTDKPLELKLQPVSSDQFKVELVENEPGKLFTLNISTLLPYKPGTLQTVAVLDSSIEEEKTIRVVASGRVPDRLDLYPAIASFVRPVRPAAGQNHASLQFWLNNYGPTLVNVVQASVDDPNIKTTVDCRSPGKSFRIQVDVPLNTVFPQEGRVLTVKTDDPKLSTLTAKIITPMSQNPQAAQPGKSEPRPAELMVGKPVPSFTLTTFEGQSLASDNLKGKVTVLNFVSPLCGFCKKQIPDLEAIRQTYQEKGVRFVNMMNTNPTGKRVYPDEEVKEMLTSLNSKLEIAADPQLATGSLFRVTSYPTCVVVGKDGNIAAANIGYGKTRGLPGQLDALLAGKPLPAASQPLPH